MPALSLTDRNILDSLKNEVHVWFCFPEEIIDTKVLGQYHSLLSVEEREKQRRFYFEKDRHSYLVSHALLRTVLSRYCDIEADKLSFEFNEYGKPNIAAKHNFPTLHFNLSHADGLSACVVTLDSDCGVDVENSGRKNKSLAIANRMFSQSEVEIIQACNESARQSKFFEFWTLREAYVKAVGTGLGGSSKDFSFTILDQPVTQKSYSVKMTEVHFDTSIKEYDNAWQFALLSPSVEHVAAVAVLNEGGAKKTIVSTVIQP